MRYPIQAPWGSANSALALASPARLSGSCRGHAQSDDLRSRRSLAAMRSGPFNINFFCHQQGIPIRRGCRWQQALAPFMPIRVSTDAVSMASRAPLTPSSRHPTEFKPR